MSEHVRWAIVMMVSTIVISGLAYLEAAPDTARTSFNGRVTAGQNFSRQLSNTLLFCLNAEPSADGAGTSAWFVVIGPRCSPSADNFASVVTPPLHGPNALDIEAWHFNPDASAPRLVRSFRFVLTKEDYDAMYTLLRDADAGKVLDAMNSRGKGEGVLQIVDFKRQERANGEWVFDWIDFRADLRWPRRFKAR
jgi:hypothetical protein